MRIQKLNVIVGSLLGVVGLYFAAAGPAAASAFGIAGFPPPGGGSIEVAAEWRLAAFMRMFGAALLLSGAVLIGVGRHLQPGRAHEFALLIAGTSGLACALAVSQQTAIWNTAAGAAVAVLLGAVSLAYGWAALQSGALELEGPKHATGE